MLLIIVKKLSCNEESEDSEKDTVVERKNLRTDLISRLDPYFRIQSKKNKKKQKIAETPKQKNFNNQSPIGVRKNTKLIIQRYFCKKIV
jgi:hypothetical protein